MSYKDLKEIHYTICPVGNTSYIAAKKGWLIEGLTPLGVKPVLLQTLPSENWKHHFDYQDDVLFREGGNIPPLWAKSNDAEVVLIGLARLRQNQGILTRKDSKIEYVWQLRGKKIGIPAHPQALIDFHKATSEHGFKIILNAHGVDVSEVQSVILEEEDGFLIGGGVPKPKGTCVLIHGPGEERPPAIEVRALDEGKVDAIYIKLSSLGALLETGKYRLLADVAANPALIVPVNNEYPNALTTSRRLAEDYPEVVTAYVKQLLRASIWAAENRPEADEILAEQTMGKSVAQYFASFKADFHRHIAPDLSDESLAALETQKRFLLAGGYLKKDFALEKWADDRFLKAAWRELRAEEAKEAV
ncbi:MAG: ABC transporter substrate-binding protein [Lachnospiraceae bacterium]|jgi:2'-hydroxybiphenyl-2-sulfinate desulfinase|nr:ABC transporter substrate-binding protein [Lachnospiraceae bacterium]